MAECNYFASYFIGDIFIGITKVFATSILESVKSYPVSSSNRRIQFQITGHSHLSIES